MSWLSRLFSSATEAVDHRFGWDRLPKPIAMLTLVGLRDRLRAENLYDTETAHPVAEARAATCRRGTRTRARSTAPGTTSTSPLMGRGRRALRPQRAARRARSPSRSRRSSSRTRALVSRELLTRERVHPGDDAQRPRGRVAPVRGARLVQPRHEPEQTLARCRSPPTTTRGGSVRCRSRAHAADPTSDDDPSTPPTFVTAGQPLVGRLADLRLEPSASPTRSGRARTASCGVDARRPPPARARRRTSTSPASPGNFWVGLGAPAHALHARAQRDLRPAARRAPVVDGRRALRHARGSSMPR